MTARPARDDHPELAKLAEGYLDVARARHASAALAEIDNMRGNIRILVAENADLRARLAAGDRIHLNRDEPET